VTNQYSSPLSERYASAAMLELWSPATRCGLWRRLWLALAEAERELGVKIPEDAIREMKANLDNIDFDAVASYEKRFRHDVMAHVHAFGDVAPKAKPFIHLGATSAYVTDNADLILMRRGLDLLRGRALDVLRSLAAFAEQWRDQPTLGYTHLQPAQLTTVGKRATLWMQDLVLDLADIDFRLLFPSPAKRTPASSTHLSCRSWPDSLPAQPSSAVTSGCCSRSAKWRSHSRRSRSAHRLWRTSAIRCVRSASPRSRDL